MMGLLDEQDPQKAEIARLENLIAQMQMGLQSTTQRLDAGDFEAPGEISYLQNLQQQMQQGVQENTGLLNDLTGTSELERIYQQSQSGGGPDNTADLMPGNPPLPMTPQDEIKQLEQQIQMLQAQQPGGGGGIYGLLGYDQRGGTGQQFQPTIDPQQMQEVFGLLAGGADDPAQIGAQYVKAMQNNDTLRAAMKDARIRITDAMRPRPVGSGYEDADGYQVQPIYDPNLNNGRGGMRSERIGKRKTNTIEIAGVTYQRNPFQTNSNAPDYWMPSVDPEQAGKAAGVQTEQEDLGAARAVSRKEANELAADMTLQDTMVRDIIFAPNFSESVGPFDTLVKTLGGAAMGGKDSLLNRKAQIMHNQLTTMQVADWKGAISERELDFFHASVPDTTDHHEVWLQWYNDVFTPTLQFAAMRARGEVDFTNSNLKDWVGSGAGRSGAPSAADNPLVQKYLNPEGE